MLRTSHKTQGKSGKMKLFPSNLIVAQKGAQNIYRTLQIFNRVKSTMSRNLRKIIKHAKKWGDLPQKEQTLAGQ